MTAQTARTLEDAEGVMKQSAAAWRRWLFVALIVWMVFSFTVGALTKFYWGESFLASRTR